MNVILCGGGTAGHVHPALAIAEIIKEKEPESRILFIGRDGGRENKAVEKAGVELKTLRLTGLRRSLSLRNFKSVIMALKAQHEASKIIKDFRPELILGTGGYVSYPVIKAGQRLGIKTVIHESNATAGLVTKILSGSCDKILLNYKSAAERLRKSADAELVGTPIIKNFNIISRQNARMGLQLKNNDIFILSFGGSIGAETLNKSCIRLMKDLCVNEDRIKHFHATGERFFEECEDEELKLGSHGCRILPYIDNMPSILPGADITITRAGALTLSELEAIGTAAILIPSPNVTDDHQSRNAKELSDSGAAITISEGEGLYRELLGAVVDLINDAGTRMRLKKRLRSFAKPDAAERIYRILRELIDSEKNKKRTN